MTDFPLGKGAEFDRIRAIAKRLGAAASGLGDDVAVIPMGGTNLVASIDGSVEGVHFRTDWLTFQEIGGRAAAAALSDLAAEGASVIGALVTIGSPTVGGRESAAVPSDPVTEIMAGVGHMITSVGGKVLGGDLVRSDKYFVDICVLGETKKPVTRGGARPGDGVWVTGTFGGPRAALEALLKGEKPSVANRARFTHPVPRIAAGQWLSEHGATAMIDVSDGLAADLGHLAAASKVGIALAGDLVPRMDGVSALDALSSGEEYELAVTLPAGFGSKEVTRFESEIRGKLTRVGDVKEGSEVEVRLGGKLVPTPKGFDHFAQ
ncbi:MAG TPA: thiamine-phosphate kinase [Gemmatimonadales bacterium]|nr:thiamine-phosphate kinase [Gemmatimonadales bacterium]